jgi:hypothetical protein
MKKKKKFEPKTHEEGKRSFLDQKHPKLPLSNKQTLLSR